MGSNLDTPRIFRILYSVWGGTPHFGSGMKTASAALFWHPPVPGDRALAHASGVVAALAQTFRPRRACDRRRDPQRSHACCLRAASQWRLSIVCIPSKVVSKVLRSSEFGLCRCRGRQAVLSAAICFGPCASEEWGFAYILRSGGNLLSACNLTLPLVAARAAALVSYVPPP